MSTVVRNLRVVATVAVQGLEDDPVRLSLLAARRLPHRWRGPLANVLASAGRRSHRRAPQALGLFLADRPDEARALLAQGQAQTHGQHQGRLVSELAVQLDGELPDDLPAGARARAAWQGGDLTAALGVLELSGTRSARRQRARLASEVAILQPGHRVALSRTPAFASQPQFAGRLQGSHRVMHLLTNSLPWTQSGYALRSHSILRAQAATGMSVEAVTRLGYPVTIGMVSARETDVVDGVSYRRLLPSRLAATPEARLAQTADLLATHVDRFGPDVLHTTTHYPNALITRAVAEATGRPWVYETRGQLEKTWVASRPAHQRQEAAASERYTLWHARETELVLAADHVVVLSDVMRDDLVSRGLPSGRVTVVPNAVDDALLDPLQDCSPREARARLGLPEEGLWVGTVTSVVDYEGLDHLVHAVAELRGAGRDIRCAIVGDGTARPALQELVASLGLTGFVILPGRVPPSQAPDWHRALDIFTVPRRDSDVTRTVTPLKPIEAMAVSRPVIASDLPALAEIVEGPGSGLLAASDDPSSLADRIRELSDDEDLRRSLGARGREFAATRTWRAMAGRYETIYDSLEGAT
ncbi:glycosyltransferase family 4 protein [Knoellia sp. S7-12]|uniref:glycosyltransferase family 4 protein n=1 Tax=Knoellia sp. S7-12 TaxID=3126698 RepID=UPI0033673ABC